MNYIPAEKLIAEIESIRLIPQTSADYNDGRDDMKMVVLDLIDSLQQEVPDKDTIIRICKLHKVWSITAPWENIEDFVITNWNSKNIV